MMGPPEIKKRKPEKMKLTAKSVRKLANKVQVCRPSDEIDAKICLTLRRW